MSKTTEASDQVVEVSAAAVAMAAPVQGTPASQPTQGADNIVWGTLSADDTVVWRTQLPESRSFWLVPSTTLLPLGASVDSTIF